MATRLWQPLGAEADATWSLDSERSGSRRWRAASTRPPVDYARFGLLFLHDGEWNGDAHRLPRTGCGGDGRRRRPTHAEHYQYFWWVDVERPGRFYALGNYGQYIYVAPDADAVIVRNGRDWGVDNQTMAGHLPRRHRPTGARERTAVSQHATDLIGADRASPIALEATPHPASARRNRISPSMYVFWSSYIAMWLPFGQCR